MLKASRCCLKCGRPKIIFQQVAQYQKPSIPKQLENHLERRKKPLALQEDVKPIGFTYSPEAIERAKRRQWARLGAVSGIDPATLLPSRSEIEEETKAEQEWWPTLQDMLDNIREKNECKQQRDSERARKIADNMAKMPGWIAKWRADQAQRRAEKTEREAAQDAEIQRAQEKFGYPMARTHPMMQEYLAERKQQDRKAKRAARKARKEKARA